jgi:hypothetical protein
MSTTGISMGDDILPIPRFPEALREAAQLRKLIPFVGAGASRIAGCPGWSEFADGALHCFVESGKFSHAQLAQVENLNPRIRLAIALALQQKHGVEINFKALLHRQARREHVKGRTLYASLSRLATTFVTTNYDEWLDEELAPPSVTVSGLADTSKDPVPRPRTVYYKPDQLTAANLNQENAVLHLHGSVLAPSGMILTTPQYVQHYANDRRVSEDDPENYVLTFLEHLFKNKTVLFVGYGLEELEILEYIIVKRKAPQGVQQPHFLLQGFFSHERELMRSLGTYYHECGIELIPYLKDEKGYDQLIEVLDALANSLPASTAAVLQELKEMEGLLDG